MTESDAYTRPNNPPPNALPVPAPAAVDEAVFIFPPPPNTLPPVPKVLPGVPVAVPLALGAFPAPAPPNAELLVVFAPRLPNGFPLGAGVEPRVEVV